jgi:hypothetical protein
MELFSLTLIEIQPFLALSSHNMGYADKTLFGFQPHIERGLVVSFIS